MPPRQRARAQVSRVKKLPIPADSTQLFGKEFVGEEGRGANLIDLFGGAVEARRAVFGSQCLVVVVPQVVVPTF